MSRLPVPPPLLERDDALALAARALQAAALGSGGTVLVTGEPGIGKSALLRQIGASLDGGTRLLWGGCEDLFSPRPLGPLRDIAVTLRGSRVQQAIDAEAPAATVFGAFFDVINTPMVRTVVVFEDVHWADEATLDLVKFLSRRIAALPVLLFLSYRDDDIGPTHPLHRVLGDLPARQLTRLTLRPLSPAGVAELAARAGRPAHGLHEATGGNPFYLTEVLDSGSMAPVAAAALPLPAAGHLAAPATLPVSVRDAVLARLARLGAAERQVLDTLCVVPGRIEPWLVQALLSPAVQPAVVRCVDRGLLVQRDGTLEFRHVLARLSTAHALGPARQQARHAQVLAALQRAPVGAGAAPALSRLVHHAAEAGDVAQVLALAPQAAREAARVGAHREAAQQFQAARRFVALASPQQQAELHESWSYEAGLVQIDDAVIDARHQAVQLWRSLGRVDKVGHNLRWLSRLYWYRGDSQRAGRYADEAVAALQAVPPGPELAWAYAVRAQLCMLQDLTDPAIAWGERAIALARQLGETEILCHALNSVGTAELFGGRPGGPPRLEQSLQLALAGGFHEQAARVYTNASEYAVLTRDHARAELLLHDGLAFDRQHDLDAWTHYLEGWQAQLRLQQGRMAEAATIAQAVLAMTQLTAVMRLPALTVLARVRVRQGHADAPRCLQEALDIALSTHEAQRIVPVVAALAERAWLAGEPGACTEALARLGGLAGVDASPWQAGEVAVWGQRAGLGGVSGASEPRASAARAVAAHGAPPFALELSGDPLAASRAWDALGSPHEAALALLQAGMVLPDVADAGAALADALQRFEALGSAPGAARARAAARARGLQAALPRRARGPYAPARGHPGGLTAREQQMLQLMARGQRNTAIAQQLGLALRTVEHHVSAVLAKLGVAERSEAVALARRQGWLADPLHEGAAAPAAPEN